MARKNKSSTKRRSNRKILDAFQIAGRAENGSDESDIGSDKDDLEVHDGIMNASKFLNNKNQGDDELEDEELDSDEALGSDDDFDVLNSKFSQTIRDKEKKRKLRAKKGPSSDDSDLDESEDDGYASIDESKLVFLSDAWDLDEKDLKDTEALNKKNDVVLDDAWDTASSDEEESESESEENNDSEASSDEDIFKNSESEDDEDVDLANTVSHLKSQIKKPAKEKKRLINERSEENEFNLPTKGNKLSLKDMISAVDSSVSKDAILIGEHLDEEKNKSKALATPLPKRIQQRHDRGVAYEITKEEVSKWEEAVQANRQAEVLKFPLNPTIKHNDTAMTFKSDNEPSTELEKKIQDVLLESSLADEKKEATFEEIAIAKMSKEDLRKRTNELRMMRELMLRDEKRAKRIKKIKSKQYRKIQKKERMRNEDLVEGSDADSDQEDHDMKRAKERMTLKHKTQSQWAKSMIKSGLSKDASNRSELEEMLRQGEKLRSKQLGYEDGDQSDDNISDIQREYDEDEAGQDDIERNKLGKGVLAMDFMKNAKERARQENLAELENLRKLENGEDASEFNFPANSVNISKNQGRRVYTPSAASGKEEQNELNQKTIEEIREDESNNLVNKLSKKFKVVDNTTSEPKKSHSKPEDIKSEIEESNPWLASSDEPIQKSKKITVVDKSSSKLAKAAAKIAKSKKPKRNDNETTIRVEETLEFDQKFSDDEENEDTGKFFKQKDLIKEAFAGDDVVTEFEIEKKRVARDEGDKEEDLTLPGWGDWAGGNKKSKKRKVVRTVSGVVQKDKRKDKNLKNVIINERVNKKNLKYQSSAVPYPFETREQYERSLRMPVGQEWTSRETHQKLTMPRIVTKQGTVIDPLKAPFK